MLRVKWDVVNSVPVGPFSGFSDVRALLNGIHYEIEPV